MGQQQSGIQSNGQAAAAVTFSKDTESVEISDRFLVTFPLELKQLLNLKFLNLSRNKITRLEGVSQILKLEDLDVSYNALNILSDDLFQSKQLINLNLSFNQISNIQSMISILKLLRTLNLSNNLIGQLPNEIGFLSNLTTLNLSFNKLQCLPKTIGRLTNLSKLIVNNNNLQLLPMEIGELVQLTLLDCAENELRILPTQISNLKSLTKLYLDNNDFLEMIPEVGSLSKLKELNLRSNQLVDLPSSLSKLSNLQILDLDDNQWEQTDYTVNDIPRLLQYLKNKKDIVNKSRKSTSKEFRRTITRQKLEDKKRLSINNIFDNSFQVIEYKKKLLQLKGENRILVRRVEISLASLNNDDVFILDIGKRIYILFGLTSNQRERQKANHLSCLMVEEQGHGNAELIVVDNKLAKKEEISDFWKEFGITNGNRPNNLKGRSQDDDEVEEEIIMNTKLFKFFEPEQGRLDIQVHAGEILYKTMLDSNSCSILDTGNDIYVWSGIYSSANEKSWSMLKAEELIGRGKRSEFSEIFWVVEGMETLLFIENFVDWVDNSWDQEFIKTQTIIQERENQQRLEAERERLRMEKEEEEELNRSNRRSYEQREKELFDQQIEKERERDEKEREIKLLQLQQQQQAAQAKQQVSFTASTLSVNNSPHTFTPNQTSSQPLPSVILPPIIKSPSSSTVNLPPIPTSPTLSEREKIKEREKEKIRERLKQRESSNNNLNSNTVVLPPIQKPVSPILPSIKQHPVNVPVVEQPKPVNVPVVLPTIVQKQPIPTPTPIVVQQPVKPVTVTPTPTPTPTSTPVILPIVQPSTPTPAPKPLPKQPPVIVEQPKPQPVIVEQPKPQTKPIVLPPVVVEQPKPQPITTTTTTSIINESTNIQMLAPLPEKAEGAKRQAASKNPIRARQERAAQEEADAKKRALEAASNPSAAATTSNSNQKPNVQSSLGGFGLLYSVGVPDETMFKTRSERIASAMDSSNSANPFSLNQQPKDQPKLLHIKGRRSPFVRQVELCYQSLNKGDVFILDCGKDKNLLYQWNGSESNRIEKGKGMDIGKSIKDKERVGCRVILLDEGKEPDEFWQILGGRGEIASAESAGDDREAELNIRKYINLYRAQSINGDKELDLIPIEGRLSKTLLEPEECYILDCISEMFVWTGTNSKLKVRNMTLKLGNEMFSSRNHCWTSGATHREFPGSEQVLFKERFPDWGGSLPIAMQQAPVGSNTASARKQEKINVDLMHKAKAEKEEVMIDDGNGKLTIWRVEEFQKVALDPKQFGQFYSGDSYLVLYTYFFKNKDNYLIYFWQGKNSSINEKGTSALLTVELDDSLKGMAKEVRVVQNKEPKHFLSVFKNRFIIHQGKDPLSKNYKPPANPKEPLLYHVRGTNEINTRAIQSKVSTCTLNSFNSFIVNNSHVNGVVYVWYGRFSNLIEKSFSKSIVERFLLSNNQNGASSPSNKLVEYHEGKETDEFFKLLGGRTQYPLSKTISRIEPRLYLCTIGTGAFVVEEVTSFAQDDLIQEDVFIVDGIDQIFIWIGTDTTEIERKSSMEVAMEYSATLPSPRKQNIPVYIVYNGKEPYIFTSLFHGWDFSKRPQSQPFTFDQDLLLAKDVLDLYTKKYTYDEIVNKKYPKGIDGSRLEDYLEDNEFITVVKMTRSQFQQLPLWKKQSLKRELRLY